MRELSHELDAFLKKFGDGISEAIELNILPTEWFISNTGNRESMLHARVLAFLAKTGFDLNYVVEVESGFKPVDARLFKPDLQLWKGTHCAFVIEYESTNSSDSRVLWKDLRHFVQSQNNEPFPDYWLIIYTLPDGPVMKWTSWDHRNKRLSELDLVMMKENPHEYYKSIFEDPPEYDDLLPNIVQYTEANSDWHRRKIVMVNLTAQGLEIDYPVCLNKHYLFG